MKTHWLDIIDIVKDEKNAKMIQNNHAFDLLCDLNKENYRLSVKNNIVYILEVNVKIQKGWIGNILEEEKNIIFQIGITCFDKKEFVNISQKIDENFYSDKKALPLPPIPPPPPPVPIKQKEKQEQNEKFSWDDIMIELKKRRKTIH